MKSKKRLKHAKSELEKAQQHAIAAARLLGKTKYDGSWTHDRVKTDVVWLRNDAYDISRLI